MRLANLTTCNSPPQVPHHSREPQIRSCWLANGGVDSDIRRWQWRLHTRRGHTAPFSYPLLALICVCPSLSLSLYLSRSRFFLFLRPTSSGTSSCSFSVPCLFVAIFCFSISISTSFSLFLDVVHVILAARSPAILLQKHLAPCGIQLAPHLHGYHLE